MPSRAIPTTGPFLLAQCVLILAASYLLADTVTGFVSWKWGIATPISQIWKGSLLCFVFLTLSACSVPHLKILIISTICILVGPITRFLLTGDATSAAQSFVMAFKVLLPFALLLFYDAISYRPIMAVWMKRILWLSTCILAANLLIGLMGYGFTSYGTRESYGIGIVGFFPAGNEVSAAFLILSGFVLMEARDASYSRYVLASGLILLSAFLIATKAAIVGSLVLVFFVPAAYARLHFTRFKPSALALLTISMAAVFVGLWQLWAVLEAAGLSERLKWIYEQQGLMGVLFSGRDEAFSALVTRIPITLSAVHWLTGIGPDGMTDLSLKATLEIDPIDLIIWFGIPGLIVGLALWVVLFFVALRGWAEPRSALGPGVLATNTIIFAVSSIAGHVLLGGMAGILLVTLNGLLLLELRRIKGCQPRP